MLISVIAQPNDLMDQKCQQVEQKEVVRQMLLAMAEIVLDTVALIFQGIEGFVFNLRARTAGFDQHNDIVAADVKVGHPAVVVGHFLIHGEPVLEKVDLIVITRAVWRHVIDPSVVVVPSLGGRDRRFLRPIGSTLWSVGLANSA